MEYVEKKVLLPKEGSELFSCFPKVCVALKSALADGWQPGQDLPAVVMSAVMEFAVGLQGVQKLPEEAKADAPAFAKAGALAGIECWEALK